MSPKRFRIRDVLINVPVKAEAEAAAGAVGDCAGGVSVLTCGDGESLICQNNPTFKTILCPHGGITPFGCQPRPTLLCHNNGLTFCNNGITPDLCNFGTTFTECPGITFTQCTAGSLIETTIVETINTPIILTRVAAAADLPALKQELRHIIDVLDNFEQPASGDDLAAVEEQLNQALEEVRARRKAAK